MTEAFLFIKNCTPGATRQCGRYNARHAPTLQTLRPKRADNCLQVNGTEPMALIKRLLPGGPLRDRLERWHAYWKWGYRREYAHLDWPDDGSGRPRILLLADRPGWAFDTQAQALKRHLSSRFDARIAYATYRPNLNRIAFDLVCVLAADEFYHTRFVLNRLKIIKELAHMPEDFQSRYGVANMAEAIDLLTADSATVFVISKRFQKEVCPIRPCFLVNQGIEPEIMRCMKERVGSLKLGWVGDSRAQHKGLHDILLPAAEPFELRIASGKLSTSELVEFYNSVDIVCIASSVEGGPLPLLEGMSCGCFPVATDVGIVPEVIRHNENGLIVERNVEAFRAAFRWGAEHLDFVRAAGLRNSESIPRNWSWAKTVASWETVFDHALSQLWASAKR